MVQGPGCGHSHHDGICTLRNLNITHQMGTVLRCRPQNGLGSVSQTGQSISGVDLCGPQARFWGQGEWDPIIRHDCIVDVGVQKVLPEWVMKGLDSSLMTCLSKCTWPIISSSECIKDLSKVSEWVRCVGIIAYLITQNRTLHTLPHLASSN